VVDALLKEEKVMDIEVGDENSDRLAIVPYVKPSSPLNYLLLTSRSYFCTKL